ncbi:MAG TPA: CCA tRNA nucleotidyltransferase [Acidimicrobiales bacterium]|nr:CCA tRNA nucleotidyltransferase [Acidimicrobiales bacterium]
MVPERLRLVIEECAPLAERFSSAGHRLYLVGGTVRDAIAGRPGEIDESLDEVDFDLTTEALPDEIERLLSGWADALWTQGKRFGTIGGAKGARRYEVTTHRAEAYSPDSRKPEVRFGSDIRTDLSRRDFTVNAMALRVDGGVPELIDPFDGLGDLMSAHRLRTPLDPAVSFSDDPLRMLRAARFLAGYGLAPETELREAVVAMHDRLSIVSAERVRDELNKLVELPDPEAGLWFVVETGLADEFLPELPGLALEQDPIHRHKDVLAHTIAVVGKTAPDRILRLAALLHDIGKPRTRAYGPGGVSFHHHDVVGARMAQRRLVALKYSGAEVEEITRLVELHLRFHTYKMGWTDAAVRRYANDAGPLLDRLNALTRADCTTRDARRVRELEQRMDELEERLAELREREALEAIRPELDGAQVMAHLGVAPGPVVGRALAALLEVRLNDGLLGEEEAYRRLEEWWREQPESTG